MKYTPATALAIKQEILEMEKQFTLLLEQIASKKQELLDIKVEVKLQKEFLDGKRGFLKRFDDLVAGVFLQKKVAIKEREQYLSQLNKTITDCETARNLLIAEIHSRNAVLEEPQGAILMQSLIAQLQPVLDKLLVAIDVSEQELSDLTAKKAEFIKANDALSKDAIAQEKRVAKATEALAKANLQREQAQNELIRETQKLVLLQTHERDSLAMSRRLTKEYREVYETMPRRGK